FNYKQRIKHFGLTEADLALERPGWVICGKFQGSLAVMDPAGAIYLKQGRDLDFLGTLEELMGIDLSTAPTPMVEIKIYSKSLPVGIALAYLLGLDELIRR